MQVNKLVKKSALCRERCGEAKIGECRSRQGGWLMHEAIYARIAYNRDIKKNPKGIY